MLYQKNKKLSYISLLSALLLCVGASLGSCTHDNKDGGSDSESDTSISIAAPTGALLMESEDKGEEYIDSFIFIGESTTYHLKSRGVLRDGKSTKQIWAPRNGTASLDTTTAGMNIVFPDTGEEMTVGEAARLKRPKRVLLTFGLNGAVEKIRRGEVYFRACYLSLINSIRQASPETEVIIGSCFPISENMDTTAYSVDAATLNDYIRRINCWAHRLAADEGLYYLNSAEALVDEKGFLKAELDAGDGYHLNENAYKTILGYIRTHTTKEEQQ